MLKRPLNTRFRELVLADKKTTTIRDKAWPVGVPIMLYHWSGTPYRSKQIDIAPVIVKGVWTIRITHGWDGSMNYECGKKSGLALFVGEGFDSWVEMDAWFRPLVKPGQTLEKTLMLFSRCDISTSLAKHRRARIRPGLYNYRAYNIRRFPKGWAVLTEAGKPWHSPIATLSGVCRMVDKIEDHASAPSKHSETTAPETPQKSTAS